MTLKFFKEEIVPGGFPEGSLVLLVGEPGTGKTIFAATYSYEEIKKGRKVLFVSLNETSSDFHANMEKLGMKFDNENFRYIDLFTVSKDAIEAQLEVIYKEIENFKPNLIVIDSITAITSAIGFENVRAFLHGSIGRFVKAFGSTAILIAEKPVGKEELGFGVEEFVADGVLVFRYIKYGEHYRRVLEIPKMRGKRIRKPQYEYTITDRGIIFLEVPRLERKEELVFEKISSGVEKLDEILNGGFYKGSITLIAGHTGTGKTTMGIFFTYKNAAEGRRAVFLSFEESESSILRAMRNYGLNYEEVKDNLIVESLIPEAHSPVEFFVKISQIIEDVQPEVVFIDSFSSIQEHMDKEELRKMIRYLQLTVKRKKIALCTTLNLAGDMKSLPATNLSTLADNIILLWTEIKEEVMSRKLLILKTRASNHSRKVYSYEITNRGIEIR